MKFGILFCGYNCENYVKDSLAPFLGREDCVISAVSVPFEEYRQQEFFEDNTTKILHEYSSVRKIANLVVMPRFIRENQARNLALEHLKREKVDAVFLVDGDEIYTTEQIDAIFDFVRNDDSVWYRLCLKNFVFDREHYLEEPFTPPRIFKTKVRNFTMGDFYHDNDMMYWHNAFAAGVRYDQIEETKTIPKEIAWVDHYSWLSDEIGKRKVFYQRERGWISSYEWDEEKDCLTFNEEYYKVTGQQKPRVLKV